MTQIGEEVAVAYLKILLQYS